MIALDPGINGSGVALFVEGRLVLALYVPNETPASADRVERCVGMALAIERALDMPARPVRLVAEWPQVYGAGKGKGDPNDLMPLAGVVCAFAMRLVGAKVSYLPHEWKGSLPKGALFEARVVNRLDETEKRNVRLAGRLTHNVYDAIGLGLFTLGRFDAKRVFPH